MIVLKKLLNNNDPYGINITFDQPVVPSYDGQDFYVIQEDVRYDFTMMVVNESSYNLIFRTVIDTTVTANIFWALNDLNNTAITGSESFIYDELMDINGSDTPEPTPDPNEADFDIIFKDDGIQIYSTNPTVIANPNNFSVKLSCYDFYLYLDFTESVDILTAPSPETSVTLFFPYPWKANRIYHADVNFTAVDDIVATEKLGKHIHGVPDLYFTSKYHIEQTLRELELDINLDEDFDLKLLIWKYSQISYEMAGLHINDRTTLLDHEETLLGNYSTYKIILTKYVGWILNGLLFVSEDSPNQGVNTSDLKLGDYEVSGSSSGTSLITAKIGALNAALKELEQAVKSISDSRAIKSFETEKTLTNRPSVTHPEKNSLYSGRRSERPSSGTPMFNYNKKRW